MKFHKNGLLALAGLIVVLVVASGQMALTIGAVIAAGIVLELLTWRGVFGRRDKAEERRKPRGPRLLSTS